MNSRPTGPLLVGRNSCLNHIPHSFSDWSHHEGVGHYLMIFVPSNFTILLVPQPTDFPTKRIRVNGCFFLLISFLYVQFWALRYVTDVALLFLFHDQNILIIYLLIGATRILLWYICVYDDMNRWKITRILLSYIYVFMIMFRALVNSSHELNSRDFNIIGIQNVHIKASIFKLRYLYIRFIIFLVWG